MMRALRISLILKILLLENPLIPMTKATPRAIGKFVVVIANNVKTTTPNKTALDRGLVRDAGIAEIYARERGGPPLPRSLNWAGSVKELVDALWLELRGA